MVAPVASAAACWIECLRLTSSTQYGTSCATSGKSTAHPCMNFENLCTSVSAPERTRSATHAGVSSPGSSASLISRIACGNRVISVRRSGAAGSRYHRLDCAHVGYPLGFSSIIASEASSEHRTEASCGTWNAVRMYAVRSFGSSCFDSTAFCTSSKSFLVPARRAASCARAFSSSASPGSSLAFAAPPRFFALASTASLLSSSSHRCSPRRNGATRAWGSANRSFTLSSPVQLSLCVFRSTNTFPASGSVPYHRSRTAIACGCFVIREWYRPSCTLSRYTELVICESAGTLALGSRSRSIKNTGSLCAMAFFTSLTSSVATQYFFVVRTKSCTPSPPLGPDPCALRSPSLDARAAATAPLPLSRANKSAI